MKPQNRKFSFFSGYGTAALRALETNKSSKALINDPYAHLLAGKIGHDWVNSLSETDKRFFIDMIAVRTKIFDDYCAAFVKKEQNLRQIVILGAGFDTRAIRLSNLSDAIIFEVDVEEVIEKKKAILMTNNIIPRCVRYVLIPADLTHDPVDRLLLNTGFDPRLPSLWLLEGLTGYLSEKENMKLIKEIKLLVLTSGMIVASFIGTSKKAFGAHNPPSKKHKFFSDHSSTMLSGNGWVSEQRRFFEIAKLYSRQRHLADYDYWITQATLNVSNRNTNSL
jgi:methyltransferase (TIGR00027 family)